MKECYQIRLPNTKKSKARWIEFIEWWKQARQSFDPMPLKLRKFKKQYNRTLRQGVKGLYKWKQQHNQQPEIIRE